uniref:Peptidylprolyl isomerase n=1 Tax=Acidobacterium capsulatum TaxID=33075 RepID=A0A7V4XRJ1_9BACT
MKTLGAVCLLAMLWPATMQAQMAAPAQAKPQTVASAEKQTAAKGNVVVLDRVIAIVNGQVLLQSDVDEERRLSALEPLRNSAGLETMDQAAQHLILRTLVLEQMKEQDQPTTVSQKWTQRGLAELRATMTNCGPYSCRSQQGWDFFLKKHGITEGEAEARWSQRMAIERFIDLRFRAGIHITREQIDQYYQKTLTPAMEKRGQHPPQLDAVKGRIRQLLLEQHVNSMIGDWLKSLKSEGSVQILVPGYGQSTRNAGDSQQ